MSVARRRRLGVVLFQLGGPDSVHAVRPFLYNLFCDPDLIDLGLEPFGQLPRKLLAAYISWKRSPHVRHAYGGIGGRSPIFELTLQQARALERALASSADARAVVAMRYWHPFTSEAVAELESFAPEELVLLPLYPHNSAATTGSSLKEWNRCVARSPRLASLPSHRITGFCEFPGYLDALVENTNRSLAHFRAPQMPHLVFSAHGVPVSLIERGDLYQKQVEMTVRGVMRRGGWPHPHCLCYQSKVGRQKWLEPSLSTTVQHLARQGSRHLLVIPVSFVTEHIETLHEINLEARAEARAAGILQFEMMPALGDSPRFIAALAELVLQAAGIASPDLAALP